MIAQGSGHEAHSVLAAFRAETGYATPKVDVRAAAFAEGRVLLVREVSDGCWTLPGGWADVNESPAESAVREVAEESGFEARAVKLAAVYDYRKRNRPQHLDSIYKLFFICELTGGSARPSIETSEVAFFARPSCRPCRSGARPPRRSSACSAMPRSPGLPTDFD